MAEIKVVAIQCDFCPARVLAGSDVAKRFEKMGGFDVCPACFEPAYETIALGARKAWSSLKRSGKGPHNGRVLKLLKQMYCSAMHEHVGSEETE